jgi:hypothetical protein
MKSDATGRSAVRYVLTAMVILAAATPAYAQFTPNILGEGTKLKTDVEINAEKERESGFKSGISKIPDAPKGKVDPWGNVRAGAAPPPPAKKNQQQSGAKN